MKKIQVRQAIPTSFLNSSFLSFPVFLSSSWIKANLLWSDSFVAVIFCSHYTRRVLLQSAAAVAAPLQKRNPEAAGSARLYPIDIFYWIVPSFFLHFYSWNNYKKELNQKTKKPFLYFFIIKQSLYLCILFKGKLINEKRYFSWKWYWRSAVTIMKPQCVLYRFNAVCRLSLNYVTAREDGQHIPLAVHSRRPFVFGRSPLPLNTFPIIYGGDFPSRWWGLISISEGRRHHRGRWLDRLKNRPLFNGKSRSGRVTTYWGGCFT